MSIDFRADQVQINKLIVKNGNVNSTNCLLVYGDAAQGSPENQGVIDSSVFPSGAVGTDTFFYVSGAVGAKGTAEPGVSVFGGDLHISGNLTIDGTYPTGSGGSGGNDYWISPSNALLHATGSVAITGSLFVSSSTNGALTYTARGPANGLEIRLGSGTGNTSIDAIGASSFAGIELNCKTTSSYSYVSLGYNGTPIFGARPLNNGLGSGGYGVFALPFTAGTAGATNVSGVSGWVTLSGGGIQTTVTNSCLQSTYGGRQSIVMVSVGTIDATLTSAVGVNNLDGTMTVRGNAPATGTVKINFFILGDRAGA
jgi:hypothetical protein